MTTLKITFNKKKWKYSCIGKPLFSYLKWGEKGGGVDVWTEFFSQQIVFYQTFFTVWLFILKFSDGSLFVAAKIRAKIFSLKIKANPHTPDKTICNGPGIYWKWYVKIN